MIMRLGFAAVVCRPWLIVGTGAAIVNCRLPNFVGLVI
jgi:hypothetical protein